MKFIITSSIFSLIVTVCLRGGLALGMIIAANNVTVSYMGKIAAIFTLSITVAQIIGYPLSILALERRDVYSGTVLERKTYHDQCFSAWIATSAILIIFSVAFIDPLSTKFFGSEMPIFFIICGALWASAMSLEIMTNYIAAVTNLIKPMALFSLAQALLLITTISLTSIYDQKHILLCIAICTLTSGMLLRLFIAKSGFFKITISWTSTREILTSLAGPSFLTVLALTLNSFFVIHFAMKSSENSFASIANFGIGMQIVSILGLLPQIVHNVSIQYLKTNSQEQIWSNLKRFLSVTALTTACGSALFSLFAPLAPLVYGPQYSEISEFLIFSSLFAIPQGVILVATQFFVINKLLWQLFFITIVASSLGIIVMYISPLINEFYMMGSLMAAGYLRMSLMLILIFCTYRKHKRQLSPVKST